MLILIGLIGYCFFGFGLGTFVVLIALDLLLGAVLSAGE